MKETDSSYLSLFCKGEERGGERGRLNISMRAKVSIVFVVYPL